MNTIIDKITIFPGFNKSGNPEEFDSLDIKKGEIVAIVGHTGSGKSLFLYDVEKLSQGDSQSRRKVLINGEQPDPLWRSDPRRRLVASLAQSMNFLTDKSVKEFIALHFKARGRVMTSFLLDEIIKSANSLIGESISYDMNLLGLSGGQTRALMIADVALVSESPIILIDEIENAGIKKDKALELLIKKGKIVFIVTHDPALALRADCRFVLRAGAVVSILKTTKKEKEIADYLNWLESYNLCIRDKIRSGQKIQKIKIKCKEVT